MTLHRLLELEGDSLGLRHLAAAVGDKAVAPDGAGQLDAGAHQEGGPVDAMEARDVLPDHVDVRRPVVEIRLVGEPDGGEVVGEGVQPDVNRVLGVSGPWHAPWQA